MYQENIRDHISNLIDGIPELSVHAKNGLKITRVLPPRKKEDAIVFSLSDGPEALEYGYVKAKTPSKFKEFETIASLNGSELGLPVIYHLNSATREVIIEWIPGEQLAYFDRTPNNQPVVTEQDLVNLLVPLVRIHAMTSESFSNLALAPRLPGVSPDETTRPINEYPQAVLVWYQEVFPWLTSGSNMDNLAEGILSQCSSLVYSGYQYILDNLMVFGTLKNFSLLHGDLHPENIIKTKNGIRFVDFEHMHFGDRAAEFAYFFEQGSQSGFIDDQRRQIILNRYLELLNSKAGIVDAGFTERILVHEVYTTLKFLGLLCGGYTSEYPNRVNAILLNDVLDRSKKLLKRVESN